MLYLKTISVEPEVDSNRPYSLSSFKERTNEKGFIIEVLFNVFTSEQSTIIHVLFSICCQVHSLKLTLMVPEDLRAFHMPFVAMDQSFFGDLLIKMGNLKRAPFADP